MNRILFCKHVPANVKTKTQKPLTFKNTDTSYKQILKKTKPTKITADGFQSHETRIISFLALPVLKKPNSNKTH